MSDLALDNNPVSATYRDLLIVLGDAQLLGQTYGLQRDAILQHILQRLREFLGENFMALDQGIPFYQQVFVKNADQSKIDAIFINTILGTPGVVQLNSYSFRYDGTTRVLSCTFSALTTNGIVNYSGAL